MRRRWGLSLLVVVTSATLIGHAAWRTFLSSGPDYRSTLEWAERWIAPAAPNVTQAFFRKTLHLTTRPVHAWVAVMAPDDYTLFVNGRFMETRSYKSGYAQNVVDLTPHLRIGPNVLAIFNRIDTFRQQPRVVVQGQYLESSGRLVDIRSDASWRVALRDEGLNSHDGLVEPTPWFHRDYDDGRWARVVEGDVPQERMTQPLAYPPALVTRPLQGEWIWAANADGPEAYFRLPLDLASRPRAAWLRLAAKRHYRLLVNGHPIVVAEHAIGTTPRSADGTVALYDVASFLHRGTNVLAIQASSETTDRGLLVDGLVLEGTGPPTWLSTTAAWTASAQAMPGWEGAGFDDTGWAPAAVVRPVLPSERPALRKVATEAAPDLSSQLRRLAAATFVLLASVVGCVILWIGTARAIAALTGSPTTTAMRQVVPLYAPSGVCLAVGYMLGFDPRIAPAFAAYEPALFWASTSLLVVLSVTAIGLAASARGAWTWVRMPRVVPTAPGWVFALGLAGLGLVLRLTDLTTEPLHHDEAHELGLILGILERGYPSLVIDGRVKQIFTSELQLYLKAPVVWLFGPGELGMRLCEALLGTFTILLMYQVGKALHGTRTGLVAAAIYTLLPSAIGMTHHGRYPSHTQFFALLTLGLAFHAVRGGILRPGRYALAVGAFVATYLSWEGAALFLPSLAVGLLVLTRPNFGWLRNGVVWAGLGFIAVVITIQLSLRIISQADWQVYGSATNDISLNPLWRYPFYDAWAYVPNFLLIENHFMLSVLTVLGIPFWFRRSRSARALAFLGVTLLVNLGLTTNLLEVSTWRYVYHVLPLLILSASMVLVLCLDHLRAGHPAGTAVGWWLRATTGATGVVATAALVLLSTTFVVKLHDLPWSYSAQYTRLGARYNSDMAGVAAYLREHRRPGDVVVAVSPQVLERYDVHADYYVQTQLRLPLLLGFEDAVGPISRKTGVPTLVDPAELEQTFARGGRVWLVSFSALRPNPEITPLLTTSAPVAYQGWLAELRLLGPTR